MEMSTAPTNKSESKLDFLKGATLFAPIGAIIISLIVLFMVVWPKFNEAMKLKDSNKEMRSRIEKLNEKAQRLAKLDRNALQKQLVSAEQLLPSEKGVFSFIRQVEQSGSTSGVIVSKIDVAPGSLEGENSNPQEQPPPPVSGSPGDLQNVAPTVQLKIALTSDYRSLQQFLTNILGGNRITSLEDLTISSSLSADQTSPQIRSAMTIKGYWKALPTQLASIESPIEELTSKEAELLGKVKLIETAPGVVEAPSSTLVPPVPLGKQDLFAPF